MRRQISRGHLHFHSTHSNKSFCASSFRSPPFRKSTRLSAFQRTHRTVFCFQVLHRTARANATTFQLRPGDEPEGEILTLLKNKLLGAFIVSTRSENVFTGAFWSPITSESDFKESSCRLLSELRPVFWDWLRLATWQPSVPAIVSRVLPRVSKGHADLTSSPPSSQTSIRFALLAQ